MVTPNLRVTGLKCNVIHIFCKREESGALKIDHISKFRDYSVKDLLHFYPAAVPQSAKYMSDDCLFFLIGLVQGEDFLARDYKA